MHLKKIIVNGFKSFADRVSIDFDKGITGIVGPNGSGKSNVIDAVRWVMGEQNAKYLRGQVATDIIFAGSAKRKSQSVAEVTLVFDNREDDGFCPPEYRHEPEVAITRRLYSDGTRDYLMNKKTCRLKDIVDFFMSTGLGGRSYSMIQQGQVERILNAKPEDIREILEEAAGTLSFKKRRDEAVKKLARTQENLSRIEDIVNELDRQEQTLRGQVEKARKWKDVSSELERDELSLFAHNNKHFQDKLDEFNAEDVEKTDLEVELITQITALEQKQMELQNQLEDSDPDLQAITERVAIIREDIARAESTILNANHVLETGEERLAEIQITIDNDAENLSVIESQMDEATNELDAAKIKAAELQEQIDSFQDEVDRVDESAQVYVNQIEDCQDQIKNIDRMLDSNTIRCESITKERERIAQEVREGRERSETIEEELSSFKVKVDEAKSKANEMQSGLDVDLTRKSELETNVHSRSERIEALEIERDEAKDKYVSSRARLTSLQELEAESSDVAGDLGKIKEGNPEAGSVAYGLLTDFIKFTDASEELSSKARSAFEKWAERIIVQDLDDLNTVVRASREMDCGALPTTVLSELQNLDKAAISSWAEKYDAESIRQFVQISNDASEIDGLLDRIYHLPMLNLSKEELRDLPNGVIVFTSQGVTLSDRHDFLIGSKAQAGLLSRKSEMDTLSTQIKALQAALAEKQSELDSLVSDQKNDRAELLELGQKLSSQNKDVMEVLSELKSIEQSYQHKEELLHSIQEKITSLQEKDRRSVEELSELGQARISLGEERETTLEELEKIKEESFTIEEQREEVFRLHQSRKVDLAKSEARASAMEESFAKTRHQMERLQSQLSARYEEKSRKQQEIEDCRTAKLASEEKMQCLLSEREQLEGELLEKREENAGLLQELRKYDNDIKERREKLNKLQNKLNSLRIDIEKVRMALSGIREQAAEKYHIEIADYEFEFDPEFKSDSVARRVSRLRKQIEDMGGINMMAIEEYDQLVARKEFIEAQREEVFSSIAILEEAIEEMEETSKNKFMEIYATINLEFGNLFPILFPGGDARLELTEPDDPLNSGVEIMCRLPGKSQQRMNLFSGGEKALTAISLIFALLKTKPTPFCFLDEVDAPLDEANVGRYNKVLEALSERFQFIVITHNRRTMEVLDTLYGVTMQEPGVSKVVGVDMKKDLPDHLRKAFKEEKKKESKPSEERAVAGASSL